MARIELKNQNNFWIFLIWGWDTVGLCTSITVITVSSETALLFVTEKYNKKYKHFTKYINMLFLGTF